MCLVEKSDAKPLCDRHHAPMQHTLCVASNTANTFPAHICRTPGCTRIYQHGRGYRDLLEDRITSENLVRKECPKCHATMYLASVSHPAGDEWECGQRDCHHNETVIDMEYEEAAARVIHDAEQRNRQTGYDIYADDNY